jgi:zinc and cadmium transporter
MEILMQIIVASLFISLISFSGIVLLFAKEKKIQKYMAYFVAFAAGTLLGNAFFDLIPESLETAIDTGKHIDEVVMFILVGIILFYIIERFIHWHHHHEINCHKHAVSTLSLIADGFHNFLDGVIIAIAFIIDPKLGVVTTITIALHEIPQEIGDFSILLHSGMKKTKALFFNFLSALTSLIGALITFFFAQYIENISPYIAAATAGSFIYIALADIIPSLHSQQTKQNKYLISVLFFLGILTIKGIMILLGGHSH